MQNFPKAPTWKAGRYRAFSGGPAASPEGPTLRAATSSPCCSGSTPADWLGISEYCYKWKAAV